MAVAKAPENPDECAGWLGVGAPEMESAMTGLASLAEGAVNRVTLPGPRWAVSRRCFNAEGPGSLFRTRVEVIDIQGCSVRVSGWFDHPAAGYFRWATPKVQRWRLRVWRTVGLETPR